MGNQYFRRKKTRLNKRRSIKRKGKRVYKLRGGGDKENCSASNPICAVKTGNKEYKVCGNDDFDLMKTLNHAYDLFIAEGKETDKLNCLGAKKSDCFCTNFDFIWLETLKYANNKVNNISKINDQISSSENFSTPESETIYDKIKQKILVKPRNFLGEYFDIVIEIAKKKWSNENGTLSENAEKIIANIEKIKIILEKIQDEFNINKETEKKSLTEEDGNKSVEEVKDAIQKSLGLFNRFFDIGKLVLYNPNQIERLDSNSIDDINSLLEDLKDFDDNSNEITGGRKTLYNKKHRKRRFNKTRKNKRGGEKEEKITLTKMVFGFLAILFIVTISPVILVPVLFAALLGGGPTGN